VQLDGPKYLVGKVIKEMLLIKAFSIVCLLICAAMVPTHSRAEQARPRLRELGIAIGVFDTGRLNAITDVAGVRIGHRTLIEGESIRTGVTAIVPHAGNVFQEKTPAAVVVGNGFGKLMGSTQVQELGDIETPILLTNTLAVAQVAEGVVRWTLAQPGNEAVRSVNAIVGETKPRRKPSSTRC
jgi:D-aminopeptidase